MLGGIPPSITVWGVNLAFTVSVEIQPLMTRSQNIDLILFRSGDDIKWAIYNTRQPTLIYSDLKNYTHFIKIRRWYQTGDLFYPATDVDLFGPQKIHSENKDQMNALFTPLDIFFLLSRVMNDFRCQTVNNCAKIVMKYCLTYVHLMLVFLDCRHFLHGAVQLNLAVIRPIFSQLLIINIP